MNWKTDYIYLVAFIVSVWGLPTLCDKIQATSWAAERMANTRFNYSFQGCFIERPNSAIIEATGVELSIELLPLCSLLMRIIVTMIMWELPCGVHSHGLSCRRFAQFVKTFRRFQKIATSYDCMFPFPLNTATLISQAEAYTCWI